MNTRKIGDKLEKFTLSYLQEIEIDSKQTNNSGAVSNNGDILSKLFVIECKKRNTKNVIINFKTWNKLCSQIPIGSLKIPLLISENIDREVFATLSLKDLILLLKEKKII